MVSITNMYILHAKLIIYRDAFLSKMIIFYKNMMYFAK